jgi:hypothetical protein
VDVVDAASMWSLLAPIDRVLDERTACIYKEQPLARDWGRVAKVAEELGEALGHLDEHSTIEDWQRVGAIALPAGRAIAALIAYTGENPRKGVCGGQEALLEELADVAMTAMLGIQHFTKDAERTRRLMVGKAVFIAERLGAGEER